MNELTSFWHQYPHIAGMLGIGILNAAVTALPTPTKDSPGWYKWLFNFSHGILLMIPRLLVAFKQQTASDDGGKA